MLTLQRKLDISYWFLPKWLTIAECMGKVILITIRLEFIKICEFHQISCSCFSKIYSSWFVYFIYSEFIDIMECEICCSGLAIFSLRYLVLFGRKNCIYLLNMVAMPQLMKLQCLSIHNWPMLKERCANLNQIGPNDW